MVTTMGEQGCVCSIKDSGASLSTCNEFATVEALELIITHWPDGHSRVLRQHAARVEKVVDTTGAGDAFNAGGRPLLCMIIVKVCVRISHELASGTTLSSINL